MRHQSTALIIVCSLAAGCNTFLDPDPFRGEDTDGGASVADSGQDADVSDATIDAGADATSDMSLDAGAPTSTPLLELPGYVLIDSWALNTSGPAPDIRIAGGEAAGTATDRWLAVAARDTADQTARIQVFSLTGESPTLQNQTSLPEDPRNVLGHDLLLLGDLRLFYAGVGYRSGCMDPTSSEWGWRRIFQPIVSNTSSFQTLRGECGEPGMGNQGVTGETVLFQDQNLQARMASFARGGRVVSVDIDTTQVDTYLETVDPDLTSDRLRGAPGGAVFSSGTAGGFILWAGMPSTNDTMSGDTPISGTQGIYEFTVAEADSQVFDVSNTTVAEAPVLFGRTAARDLFIDRIDTRFTLNQAGEVDAVIPNEVSAEVFADQADVVEIAAAAPANGNNHFAVFGNGDSGSHGLRIARYNGEFPVRDNVTFGTINWPTDREVVSLDIFTTILTSSSLLLGVGVAWRSGPDEGYDVYAYELEPTF